MSIRNKFIKSEFSEDEEKQYLENLLDKHYDRKLKEKYTSDLKSKYNLSKSEPIENKQKSNKTILLSLKFLGSIAAMILVFLVIKPIFNSTNSPMELANSYILNEKFVNQGVKRGENIADANRQKAILAYNESDYTSAIGNYSNVFDKTDEDKFFNGLAYMYNNQFDEAVGMFNTIQNIDAFKFSQELKWYLSLCLIKTDKLKEAEGILIQIEGWKKEEIKEILESI